MLTYSFNGGLKQTFEMKEVLLKSNGVLIFKIRVFENAVAVHNQETSKTTFLEIEQCREFVRNFRRTYPNPQVI